MQQQTKAPSPYYWKILASAGDRVSDNTPLPLSIIFWARYLDIYTKHRMDLNIVNTQNIGNTFLH